MMQMAAMTEPMLRWLVLETKPGEERRVLNGVIAQAYAGLLPLRWKSVKKDATHSKLVRRPLFPRYVFAGVAEDQRWQPLASTRGVSRLILAAGGDVPAVVPVPVIEDLRARLDHASGCIPLEDASPIKSYVPNATMLEVLEGPFAGYEGIYKAGDDNRVRILLDILGRSTEVSFPSSNVAPAKGR